MYGLDHSFGEQPLEMPTYIKLSTGWEVLSENTGVSDLESVVKTETTVLANMNQPGP